MADRVGQQLGQYRLTRLLGRGGFAEVYLGEHVRLGTQAAIKVLHTQLAGEDEAAFQQEARTIAALEHPQIVRVLDFDVQEGTPFLVMSYAPNGTLRTRHPKGACLPLATLLPYVKQVADALQYAHEEKLVHRDIKPENMLLSRRGDVLLSDFGIATVAQSSRYQGTQEVAGTVAYMAPEQVQGKPRPASDQYALGITIYEWLSGDRPFHGSFSEVATQHLFTPPPPLREKLPDLSPAVEQAILIALSKDPKERFGSVQAFATALEQASLLDQPTQIVRPSAPLPSAPTPPAPALAPTIRVAPPVPASPLVTPPSRTPSGAALPPTERISQPAVSIQPIGTTLCIYRGHADEVWTVAWSPDSRYIAFGSRDKTVQVWDVINQHKLVTYQGHASMVYTVAWSPDGRYLASGSMDKTAQVWSFLDGYKVAMYRGHAQDVTTVAWSPDGQSIASGSSDRTVHVWHAMTGSPQVRYQGHSKETTSVAWSPESTADSLPHGSQIASAGRDKTVQIWQPTRGNLPLIYSNHAGIVNAVVWSPDGQRLASASDDGQAHVWRANGEILFIHQGHTRAVQALAWSPDGARIASASWDSTVQIWDATNGRLLFTYRGHSDFVFAVAWSPDGTRIASAGRDKTVQVWSAG